MMIKMKNFMSSFNGAGKSNFNTGSVRDLTTCNGRRSDFSSRGRRSSGKEFKELDANGASVVEDEVCYNCGEKGFWRRDQKCSNSN